MYIFKPVIYSLIDWYLLSHQCKTTGYFGSRFSWLDDLPPFKGVFSVRQPCLYLRSSSPTTARKTHMAAPTPTVSKHGTCSCALCHEDLVKLQVQHGRRLQHIDLDLSCVKIKDLRFIFCQFSFINNLIFLQMFEVQKIEMVMNNQEY